MYLTYVKKKNGIEEPFQPNKMNRWVEWASRDTNANWSLVVTNATKKMYNGATTSELQESLISSCLDLIDIDVDYDIVASRLYLANLRKEVYGVYSPPLLKDMYNKMIHDKLWIDMGYTICELEYLEEYIDHSRDDLYGHSGLKQMHDKYLISVHGKVQESPQMLYMAAAMAIFRKEPIYDVVKLYNLLSLHMINVPTPPLIGLRTPNKGMASCCLIKSNDTLSSINAAINVAYTMTAHKAGIGIELGVRSEGDPVKGGRFEHYGKLPYYNLIDKTVKANSQEGRGGSATVQFSIFDPEIETLLRLKSQRVSEIKRIDKLDYSVAISDYFISKFINSENISLFSIKDAPEVYEAFFSKDRELFKRLYEEAERDVNIPRETVEAKIIFKTLFQQRIDTGRIYIFRADIINERSTFKDPIYSSNLCVAPETTVLTRDDYVCISGLVNKKVDIWNGKEWSSVTIRKTGENQKLLRVNTNYSDRGLFLYCTPYHKWYIYVNGKEEIVTTSELKPGDIISPYKFPLFLTGDYFYQDSVMVESIIDEDRYDDTYCFNEPLENKGMFNGILTGQCQEIVQPTKGYNDTSELYEYKESGETSLCTLGGVCAGRIPEDIYEESLYILLKMVDSLIDYQEYVYPSLEYTSIRRRNVGIGLINIAYLLADSGYSYSSNEGKNLIHRETERFSFYLHKASVTLAKEKGPCEWFDRTTYSDGVLPIDNYPNIVDTVHTQELLCDWEGLRVDIKTYGMRNSTLEALMPSESSSVTIGATNSCEPIRDLIIHKQSGVSSTIFIAPDYKKLAFEYDLAFNVDNKSYVEIVAIIQKFLGQSISYNEYYDYRKYDNEIIPIKEVVSNWLYACKLGIKTFYYFNTDVSNGGAASSCSGGGCEL